MWFDALTHDPLTRLLAQVLVALVIVQLVAAVARRANLPAAVGEISAGILLGPSLLGWVLPSVHAALFPTESLAGLELAARIGRLLFMFLVGLEVDPRVVRARFASAGVISASGIAVGFGFGWALASLFSGEVSAMFLGAALAVTGFPAVARTLAERHLYDTPVGRVAHAAATATDALAWCLVALVVVVAAAPSPDALADTLVAIAAYVAVLMAIVRPVLVQIDRRVGSASSLTPALTAAMLAIAFGSSWATGVIGVHALFGALLAGILVPKQGKLAHALAAKIEEPILVFLLPVFLVYSGLRTDLGLLGTPRDWLVCGVVFVVATAGKVGGAALGARWSGLSWREAGTVGAILGSRGVVPLIVLNLGVEGGLITPKVFTMLVVAGLASAVATSASLRWLVATKRDVPLPAVGAEFKVLVCVASGRSGPGLVSVAAVLVGEARSSIEALHLIEATDRPSLRLAQGDDDELDPLILRGRELGVDVRPTSFVSSDVANDIRRIARVKRADFVLMGWHRPIVNQTLLGGVVYRVMTDAPSDVGVFVDRGLGQLRKLLVPFGGSPHDRAALAVARRIGLNCGAAVTVVGAANDEVQLTEVDRAIGVVFGGAASTVGRVVGGGGDPVDAVLRESALGYDLVVVGVGDAWGLQERFIGLHPERLMRDCPVSLLVVRGIMRSAAPTGAAAHP